MMNRGMKLTKHLERFLLVVGFGLLASVQQPKSKYPSEL